MPSWARRSSAVVVRVVMAKAPFPYQRPKCAPPSTPSVRVMSLRTHTSIRSGPCVLPVRHYSWEERVDKKLDVREVAAGRVGRAVHSRWVDLREALRLRISCPKRLKGMRRLCRFYE